MCYTGHMLYLWAEVLVILLGIAGFSVALYIWNKKRMHKTLVCPLKAHCDPVINSDFSKFFGIPVELLGMAYYGLLIIAYATFLAAPHIRTVPVSFILLVITTAAFLFSVYLTFIQAVAIKQYCSWCLFSASLCTVIFLLAALTATGGLVPLLAEMRGIITAVHMLGLALGLGGATITDLFFFRFLKDFRISEHEAEIMKVLSQVIWLGLAILVISGLGLYIPQAAELNESAKFLTKMVVVGVIIINGAFLNLVISPRLVSITFRQDHMHQNGELRRFRRLAFALGAISFTSWYTAFILGMLRLIPVSLGLAIGIYGLLLVIAVAGSQIMERLISRDAILRNQ